MVTWAFPAVAVTVVGEKLDAVIVPALAVWPAVTVMPVCSPLYLIFPLESLPRITAFLLDPAGTLDIVPEWAEQAHGPPEAKEEPNEL